MTTEDRKQLQYTAFPSIKGGYLSNHMYDLAIETETENKHHAY